MKKFISLLLALTLILTLAGPVQTVSAASMMLNRNSITIGLNESYQLKILNIPASYKALSVKWKSSNTNTAVVSNTGLVTGKTTGNTKITATFNKKVYTCNVRIYPSKNNLKDAASNVKLEYLDTQHTLYCVFTNNSDFNLTLNFKITFYDEFDKAVSVREGIVNIYTGDTQISEIYKSDKIYNRYEISYDNIGMYTIKNIKSKVDIEPILNNYSISVSNSNPVNVQLLDFKITNNTLDRYFVNLYVMYYKDGELSNIQNYGALNRYIVDVGESIFINPIVVASTKIDNIYFLPMLDVPEYDNYSVVYNVVPLN